MIVQVYKVARRTLVATLALGMLTLAMTLRWGAMRWLHVRRRLLPRVLEAAGLLARSEWVDPWLSPTYNPTKSKYVITRSEAGVLEAVKSGDED